MAQPGYYDNAPFIGNQGGGGGGYGQGDPHAGQGAYPGGGGYGPPGHQAPYGEPGPAGYPPPGVGMGGYQQQQGGNMPGTGIHPAGYGGVGGMAAFQQSSTLNILFFAAGCCIMLASFFGGLVLLFSFSLVDFLNLSYICTFGFLLALLDRPLFKSGNGLSNLDGMVTKYINILTRITGKGIAFVFLGSALLSSIFSNLDSTASKVLAFILNTFVIVVGLVAITMGIIKSKSLDRERQKINQDIPDASAIIDSYAKMYPRSANGQDYGLTMDEFNSFTQNECGWSWTPFDLALIFNALRCGRPSAAQGPGQQGMPKPQQKLNLEDLRSWLTGGHVVL